MKELKNSVIAITGAGSGIGRALALSLVQRGAKLALSDNNIQGLNETTQRSYKIDASAQLVCSELDVANAAAVEAWAKDVRAHFSTVNVIINNAGVALVGDPLSQLTIRDVKWLMDINFYGVLHGTRAFLPILSEAPWGHVVNISSIFGIVAVAQQSAYNASKFAVRGLTEALRAELDSIANLSCTSVHPGGVKTNIAASSRFSENASEQAKQDFQKNTLLFERIAKTTPERAAQLILRAIQRDKPRLLIGADARIIDLLQRLFPSRYTVLLRWLWKTQES